MTKTVKIERITAALAELLVKANFELPEDVKNRLEWALSLEESPLGKSALKLLLDNAAVAKAEHKPICQDCGSVNIRIELGEQVCLEGEALGAQIQATVGMTYKLHSLRSSMVADPITERVNTGDNTPALIEYAIVTGDDIKISVLLKGGGSENMSRAAMLSPEAGLRGVADFALDTVRSAGAGACPPVIVAIGVGGTFDRSAALAKQAFFRPLGTRSADEQQASLESRLLSSINDLGIGPAGMGGRITALDVLMETFPTHMATLPVTVLIGCHALRRYEMRIS